MRLLQLGEDGSLSLVEYNDQDLPPYTILSHTWGPSTEEVSFADFKSGSYKTKAGYKKIHLCSIQTRKDGLKHFWIDTCCINKESSAELSEAINSMYMWYQLADVCYAYLSDVRGKDDFSNSRWFTRGWTLQELLAPADVIFFGASWSAIGVKTSLTRTLSRCTGIDEDALRDGAELGRFSIAEKMSWAAHRRTSRVEDEAYCLMGLFGVNMPLIYGEGRQAFVRLQEELLKRTDDASIFAYAASAAQSPLALALTEADGVEYGDLLEPQMSKLSVKSHPVEEVPTSGTTGLFATSPLHFQATADCITHPTLNQFLSQETRTTSASRIRRSGHLIKLHALFWDVHYEILRSVAEGKSKTRYSVKLTSSSVRKLRLYAEANYERPATVAFLDCRRRSGGIIGIMLQKTTDRGTYTRLHYPSVIETQTSFFDAASMLQVRTMYVEADMLRFRDKRTRLPVGLPDPYLGTRVMYYAADLHPFCWRQTSGEGIDGGLLQSTVHWFPFNPGVFPTVILARSPKQGLEDGVICTLSWDGGIDASLTQARTQDICMPVNRSFLATVPFGDGHVMVLRSQMQWKREHARSVDRMGKQCLIALSIERMSNSEGRQTWLEDRHFLPSRPI